MKPDRLPESFLETLPSHPVPIKPFNPNSKRLALIYQRKLEDLLAAFSVQVELFGSTDLEIAGKGEWEFAIWLDDETWYPVLIWLINHFGSIYTLIDDFALFHDEAEGTSIEIIPMRGAAAARNRALMQYWRSNPEAVQVYEQGKLENAYSKQAYYRWKNQHICEIVETL